MGVWKFLIGMVLSLILLLLIYLIFRSIRANDPFNVKMTVTKKTSPTSLIGYKPIPENLKPNIQTPSISPPNIQTPSISPPNIQIPSISPPNIQTPSISPPNIIDTEVPSISPPNIIDTEVPSIPSQNLKDAQQFSSSLQNITNVLLPPDVSSSLPDISTVKPAFSDDIVMSPRPYPRSTKPFPVTKSVTIPDFPTDSEKESEETDISLFENITKKQIKKKRSHKPY